MGRGRRRWAWQRRWFRIWFSRGRSLGFRCGFLAGVNVAFFGNFVNPAISCNSYVMDGVEHITGRGAFSRARKIENRQRLLEAAGEVFERMGYTAASVDDIAQAAGVSRQTFYRHFESKIRVGLALHESLHELSMPYWQALGPADASDPERLRAWLTELLEFFATRRGAIRVFMEMTTVELVFLEQLKTMMQDVIGWLGARLPAFAGAGHPGPGESPRAVEAWLLISQIYDQYGSAAIGLWPFSWDSLTEVLAANFIRFVERHNAVSAPKSTGRTAA
jgi:AcrR family transcriptional regulator